MSKQHQVLAFVIGALGLALSPIQATAQKFPTNMVRIIVPFAAGGGVDSYARLLAQKLQDQTGGTFIIENRGGANGTAGGLAVVRAPADGYTVLFSASTSVMSKLVMRAPPYDPVTDLLPIARVGEAPLLMVIPPGLSAVSLSEVSQSARANPDKWTASTAALGSPGHLAAIAFGQLSGLTLTIVPYRGTAPALSDVAGGHVQMLIDAMVVLLPLAQSGGVKPILITSAKRSKLAPEIFTSAEQGMPGLNITSWYGVWGPREMKPDLRSELNRLFTQASQALAQEGKLDTLGIEPKSETPDEFAKAIDVEVKRASELLKAASFQPE